MNNNLTFVTKIIIASLALSAGIKYAGPQLNIPPTSLNASIAIFLPSILLAMIFFWRSFQQSEQQ
ncbi:hypothetical protein NG798_11310 [Ancylothrix sp. C2]|uniref:hypothetical protein n=1 Tax=Ancylothrix sp. D3o TaxID=2953691 RepID=UPI0021BAC210|nr:hypothetical protein [Ancylothrix sp. D3o]MCT7950378.1 hypothetical protein [Ancylothrix sp. D3o]